MRELVDRRLQVQHGVRIKQADHCAGVRHGALVLAHPRGARAVDGAVDTGQRDHPPILRKLKMRCAWCSSIAMCCCTF
eukprot:14226672-Alexandrium_andersonii.AAC.1